MLDFRLEGNAAVIVEVRDFCGVPGAGREVPVARLRHLSDGHWYLDYADRRLRWRRVATRGGGSVRRRAFVTLLREIDEDPEGLFWGRVNGKSLRYRAILGAQPCAPAAVVAARSGGVHTRKRRSEADALPGA